MSADTVPHKVTESDASCLNDTAEVPEIAVGPGSITFDREQDALSVTLRGFCDGSTSKEWVVVYPDGQTDGPVTGKLICTAAGKATKGFANKLSESYKVVADGPITRVATAV